MVAKTHPDDAKALEELIELIRKDHEFPHSWIANQLGTHRQGVWAWRAIPVHFVAKLEKITGIPRHKLLPHALKKHEEALSSE